MSLTSTKPCLRSSPAATDEIAQTGTAVGLGLLLDTLLIRSLVIPAVATLAGRWFWWPIVVHDRAGSIGGHGGVRRA